MRLFCFLAALCQFCAKQPERLFRCTDMSAPTAAARLAMLRWALLQFLVGNNDAHGKNLSFFVRPGGRLEPTPGYDLVSVLQYDGLDNELVMAYGEVFSHAEVSPFALAGFAARCGIDRTLRHRPHVDAPRGPATGQAGRNGGCGAGRSHRLCRKGRTSPRARHCWLRG